jgi:hypothetical protein
MYARMAAIAALLALASFGHADAATDRDQWVKRLQKYAVVVGTPEVATVLDAVDRAKMACVCTESGSLYRRPGLLVVGEDTEGLSTFCVIPAFDPDGALVSAAGCGSFVPMAK